MNNVDQQNLPLSDRLAIERTKLANQRTLLAMLRTGLYFLVMGFTIISIDELSNLRGYYWVFFVIGGLFIVFGILIYFRINNKLKNSHKITL